MVILFIILFIANCVIAAYGFVKIKLIEEDIESLYNNYANELEKSFYTHPRLKGEGSK